MGSCFLSFLETQSKLLLSASDLMAPLGAYKEVGKGLNDAFSNSAIKEATVGWLAAAQVRKGRWAIIRLVTLFLAYMGTCLYMSTWVLVRYGHTEKTYPCMSTWAHREVIPAYMNT